MGYWLGVDLGTTYSAAAVTRRGGTETVALGTNAHSIPSVVYIRDDGEILVGDAAARRAVVDPAGVVREFKRRFGDPVPIVVRGTPYPAEFFAARLLERINQRVEEQMGEPAEGIVLTHPASWGPFRQGVLQEAASLAGLGDVELLSEAQAAGIHYARQRRIENGALFAVYDLGGGTFDAAIVRKSDAGFDLVGDAEGIDRLGGIDFDEAVMAHVRTTLADELEELDHDDPAVTPALAQLRTDCVLAKEDLSVESATRIPVLLPGVATDVRMTRVEFQQRIRPLVDQTIAILGRAVSGAGIDPEELDAALLVGGSSRIPLVAEQVAAGFDRPVAIDTHPKHAVALGAAAHGAVLAGGVDELAAPVDETLGAALPSEPPPPEVMPATEPLVVQPPVDPAPAHDRDAADDGHSADDVPEGSLVVSALLGVAALALISVAIWFFAVRDDGADTASTTVPTSVQAETTLSPTTLAPSPPVLATVAVTPIGSNPWTPLLVDGELWVPVDGDGVLKVVRPDDHTVVATIDLTPAVNPACPPVDDEAPAPETPIEAGGDIWVPDRIRDVVYRVDPLRRSIDSVFCVGANPQQLAASDAAVWARGRDDASLTRIDLATSETARFELGGVTGQGFEIAVAADGREVWAVTADPPGVHRFDRATQTFTLVADLINPYAITIAGGSVWASDRLGESGDEATDVFYRRVLSTGQETVIPAGRLPIPPIEADGALWFASRPSQAVSRLDPVSGEVTHTFPFDGEPLNPVADGRGNLWVVSRGDVAPALTRIDLGELMVAESIPLDDPRADEPVVIGDRIWVALASADALLEAYWGPENQIPS